jgi:hypothetical protein
MVQSIKRGQATHTNEMSRVASYRIAQTTARGPLHSESRSDSRIVGHHMSVVGRSHIAGQHGILRICRRKFRSDCTADAILGVGDTSGIRRDGQCRVEKQPAPEQQTDDQRRSSFSRSHDVADNVETAAESFGAIDDGH